MKLRGIIWAQVPSVYDEVTFNADSKAPYSQVQKYLDNGTVFFKNCIIIVAPFNTTTDLK